MDVERLQKDALAGIPGAQYNLGVWHLYGRPGQRNPDEARRLFLAAAEQNFAPAQSALGLMYQRAQGVPQDFEQARSWFSRSAEQGFAEALYSLAELFAIGLGGERDESKARNYYEAAAAKGHPAAQTQLAYCLDNGIGGPASPSEATAWLFRAASDGDLRGVFGLARRYETGNTLLADPVRARALYLRAARNDYPLASQCAARISNEIDDDARARSEQLAEQAIASASPDTGCIVEKPPVQRETLSESPRISVVRNLLMEDERAHLIAMARPNLHPSRVLRQSSGEVSESSGRTSGEMTFADGLKDLVVHNIEARLAKVADIPVEHGEALIVLHYDRDDEYRPHYDFFDPGRAGSSAVLERGGQRICTLLTFLSPVDAGGETDFPDIGLTIAPEPGKCVLFFNVQEDGTVDPRTRHAGCPVTSGEKWLATKWFRERTVPR